jgi:hypothetical protein
MLALRGVQAYGNYVLVTTRYSSKRQRGPIASAKPAKKMKKRHHVKKAKNDQMTEGKKANPPAGDAKHAALRTA